MKIEHIALYVEDLEGARNLSRGEIKRRIP